MNPRAVSDRSRPSRSGRCGQTTATDPWTRKLPPPAADCPYADQVRQRSASMASRLSRSTQDGAVDARSAAPRATLPPPPASSSRTWSTATATTGPRVARERDRPDRPRGCGARPIPSGSPASSSGRGGTSLDRIALPQRSLGVRIGALTSAALEFFGLPDVSHTRSQMLQPVMFSLLGMKRVLILNGEARGEQRRWLAEGRRGESP